MRANLPILDEQGPLMPVVPRSLTAGIAFEHMTIRQWGAYLRSQQGCPPRRP
jgi:hypothetical protein